MMITAYDLAQRFIGVHEAADVADNPLVLAMLRLDDPRPAHDEVPWCSAFVNFVAWLLRLPRSKSLRARSWLEVGTPVDLADARAGFDVVVLKRGSEGQLGAGDVNGPGHVGWFAGRDGDAVLVLGGNQSDAVTITRFPRLRVLGVRRLVNT